MSFPTVSTVVDNFNRAAIGATWTTGSFYGDAAVSISASTVLTGASFAGGYKNDATYGPDLDGMIDISTADNTHGDQPNLLFRLTNGNSPNGYGFCTNVGASTVTGRIIRIDGGANTQLGATFAITALASGHKIGANMTGSVINAYQFTSGAWGASLANRSDSTYTTAGNFGVEVQTGLLDNLAGGTISSSIDRTGTGATPHTASGADQAVWAEQGTGVTPGTASGADQSVWVEQGTGTTTSTASGRDNFITADSGTATAPATASGADQTVFVEQGTGTSTATGSGADNFLTADSGTGTATGTGSADDQTVWVETGTGTAAFTASGASQLLHPGGNVYDRSGVGTVTATGGADTSIVWAEAGTGTAPATGEGSTGIHGGMGSWVPFYNLYAGEADSGVKVNHGHPIGLPTLERQRREAAAADLEREQARARKAQVEDEMMIEMLMLL